MAILGGFISQLGGGLSRFSGDGDDIIIGDSDTTFDSAADDNIAIGDGALDATSGAAVRNIAIGVNALTDLTTSDGVVAVGYHSGKSIQGGARNTCVGYRTGEDLVSGESNTMLGFDTGKNITGSHNTLLGNNVLGNATAGADHCTVIGSYAGYLTTEGADGTVAVGSYALTALTTGAGNIAIGYQAADGITTGARNIAIGYIAMGDAGGATVLGSADNVFIGNTAGGGAWTTAVSDKNVGIGNFALDGAMNGALNNVAVGHNALSGLTTGDGNTCIGSEAGVDITTGESNVAVGYQALDNLDSGDKNTAVGTSALTTYDNSGSGNNTAVGFYAGGSLTGGKFNTIMGSYAGDLLTSGQYNTIVGYEADADVNSQTNTTIIGTGSVFKFLSKEYTCDHASDSGDDARSASSESSPLKLPAYSIIKSISVIVKTLSNIGTYNVALYLSTDTASPADDTVLTASGLVEVLGGGASDTCSGNSASAVDIALGSGAVLKQSYYNGFGGAGLPVDSAAKYIHVGNAGTGNGDTDPSTAGVLKVLVEYVGLE